MTARTATPQPRTLVGVIEWMRRELSWHITSWEDIGSIINGPLLFLAALIAGVNQITGGAVLQGRPWVGISWAILQIVGIDMQYMACARRTKDSVTTGKRLTAFLWLMLALVLAVPVLWANVTFTLQLMLGWSDAQAMSLIGLTPLMVAIARAVLQALLAFISAITRETRPHAAPEAPSVHTDPIIVPPPTRRRKPQPARSNAGVSMAKQMQIREGRIQALRSYMETHPGETVSVSQAMAITGAGSRSTASGLIDKAKQREVSA